MIKMHTLLTEITLGGVTPYATQFTWSRADEGHRETKDARCEFGDGISERGAAKLQPAWE